MGGKGARRRERNQRRAAEEKARHPALQAKRQRGGADDRVGAPDPPPIQCGRGLTPRAPLREGRPPPGTCAAAAATAGRTARWSA